MSDPRFVLFALLALLGVGFLILWARAVRKARLADPASVARVWPNPYELFVGAFTDFFDTLGIGSYATTTMLYRARKTVPDEKIPGTMNVGHGLPTFAQAFIYITIVKVDITTLALMIAAAVSGAWLGAGVVSRWPKQRMQLAMGLALLGAAAVILMRQLDVIPHGGDTLGLSGPLLVAGLAGNFVLGAMMNVGIGLYGPCMILVGLLGMNATTAFPIMMGSCAFLMPVSGLRFIARGSYSLPAAIGLTIAGIPAVLLAAYLVKSLPLRAVQWLVIVVVVYTAVSMLRAARAPAVSPTPETPVA